MACRVPRGSVAMSRFEVIGLHNSSDTVLATGLTRFSQVEKDARGAVDTMARRIGRADQAEQPLIFPSPIGERILHPGIEPTARNIEQAAHDGRIKLLPMGFDEGVLQSDMLRSPSIPHGSSPLF